MTAYQILIHELAQHGTITYADLLRRHGDKYGRENFANAVMKARRQGLVTGSGGKGKPIVKAGSCPCCGREL